MIICPRCGYQAPDGSPWCPRCGYGCPYPVPYQQQPLQQMPAPYQPPQIPAQYDVVDLPPQPDPAPTPKRKKKNKKKKKLPKWLKIILIILGIILLPFLAIVVWAIVDTIKNPPVTPTNTPTATYTATVTNTPTFTSIPPTATLTIQPTNTPAPTDTPIPTNTPVPLPEGAQYYTVREGENCWSIAQKFGISEDNLRQANGMSNCNIGIGDQIVIPAAIAAAPVAAQPNTGIRGSVAQEPSNNAACNIKGNVNSKGERIYHCLNSPSYSRTNVNFSEGDQWFCSPEEAEAAGFRKPENVSWCQY